MTFLPLVRSFPHKDSTSILICLFFCVSFSKIDTIHSFSNIVINFNRFNLINTVSFFKTNTIHSFSWTFQIIYIISLFINTVSKACGFEKFKYSAINPTYRTQEALLTCSLWLEVHAAIIPVAASGPQSLIPLDLHPYMILHNELNPSNYHIIRKKLVQSRMPYQSDFTEIR